MTDDLFPRTMSLAVHELRTPVTVVAGYLRMLLREQAGPLSDKQRKMLEEADKSCARLGAIVAEMSELGKLEARELVPARHDVDLAGLVAELSGDMQEGADRGVRLEVRGSDRPIMVAADRTRLAAVVKAVIHAGLRERGEPGVLVAACTAILDTNPAWAVLAVGDEATLPALLDSARGDPPPFDE